MFALISRAMAQVIDLNRRRYVGLSHVEADECGANQATGASLTIYSFRNTQKKTGLLIWFTCFNFLARAC